MKQTILAAQRDNELRYAKLVREKFPYPENEIKAGPELDQAVARAIGWTYKFCVGTRDRTAGEEFTKTRGTFCELLAIREPILKEVNVDTGPEYVPRYSTDLNAAFAAAEKVFGNGFMVCVHPKVSSCIAMLGEGEQHRTSVPGQCQPNRASTPALAICAAVLKLKES
jgi:hypothetical protein